MVFASRHRKCIAAIMLCLSMATNAVAQGIPGPVRCPKGLGVGCAPKRDTYGYYETSWRKWPTARAESSPRRTPEQVPTPAVETPPSSEPQQPKITPDDVAPGATQPATPAGPDAGLPFDDHPGAPPKEPVIEPDLPGLPGLPPKTTEPPAGSGSPDLPSELQSPTMLDTPPIMPDDDPFKDDPQQPPTKESRAAPEAPGLKLTPASPIEDQMGLRWRATGKPAAATEIATRTSFVAPLAPVEVAHATEVEAIALELPTDDAPARSNPLRGGNRPLRDPQVVRTAAWSAEESAPAASTQAARRNPLRNP